jgi:hypothetical protein
MSLVVPTRLVRLVRRLEAYNQGGEFKRSWEKARAVFTGAATLDANESCTSVDYFTDVVIDIAVPVLLPTVEEFAGMFKKATPGALGVETVTLKLKHGSIDEVAVLLEDSSVRKGILFCRPFHRLTEKKVDGPRCLTGNQARCEP